MKINSRYKGIRVTGVPLYLYVSNCSVTYFFVFVYDAEYLYVAKLDFGGAFIGYYL